MHELVCTGVPGFDEILGGGIRRGSSTLIEGVPGTGKTTVALSFLHQGAAIDNEPGLAITFSSAWTWTNSSRRG